MKYIEFSIDPQSEFKDQADIYKDILTADLAEIGFESFVEENKIFKAYALDENFEKETLNFDYLEGKFYEVKPVIEQNWNEEWEKNYPAIVVEDRCIIRADFHEKPAGIEYDLLIVPKMSFGTGHHETTYLMTSFLMDEDVKDKSVLDMGCGTAVLAILAYKKEAKYVEAIDIDDWAYENTLENCKLNKAEDIVCKLGDASLLGETKYDIILANINRNILLSDMPAYSNVLNSGGTIFFSGFYETDVPKIEERANEVGFTLVDKKVKNHWTSLKMIKK